MDGWMESKILHANSEKKTNKHLVLEMFRVQAQRFCNLTVFVRVCFVFNDAFSALNAKPYELDCTWTRLIDICGYMYGSRKCRTGLLSFLPESI